MPEGDSLHTAAQRLGPALVGRAVRELRLPRRDQETEGLAGRAITGVEARGKNLLVHFDGGLSLHVHLKMNGRFRLLPRDPGRETIPGARAVVVLDTDAHRLVVRDAPVARLLRTRDIEKDAHFRGLGPDLLAEDFDAPRALDGLKARAAEPLGVALMDQGALAGIGNVWKSELCFNLKLDPFAPVGACTDAELRAFVDLAHAQMRDQVYGPKRTLPDPFAGSRYVRRTRLDRRQGQRPVSVYDREGHPCYDCGTPIRRTTQGEPPRSTYHCPVCQPSRESA
jgi:endonuclease-8